MKHSALATCLVVLVSIAAGRAHAYCRTSTCSTCPRDAETGCTIGGTPIAWPGACTSFSMNQAASQTVELENATALMREALATWQNARCGDAGEHPSIQVRDEFGPVLCARAEYNERHGNANLIVFRDDVWRYQGRSHELAATWVSFNDAGEIFDADMEINATRPLGLPESNPDVALGVIVDQHDLLSIMLHETGHFLGLDHTFVEGAVMQVTLPAATIRDQLSPDDEAAICAAYPPGRDAPACDYTPHGGFAPACGPEPVADGCRIAPDARAGRLAPLVASIALVSLWGRRKRVRR